MEVSGLQKKGRNPRDPARRLMGPWGCGRRRENLQPAQYAAFALAVVLAWYQTLGRFITEITVRLNRTIEFKSALRRTVLLPREITAVRTFQTDDDGTRTQIVHRRGKIDISHIHDIDAVVSLLRAQNARIQRIDEREKTAQATNTGRSIR